MMGVLRRVYYARTRKLLTATPSCVILNLWNTLGFVPATSPCLFPYDGTVKANLMTTKLYSKALTSLAQARSCAPSLSTDLNACGRLNINSIDIESRTANQLAATFSRLPKSASNGVGLRHDLATTGRFLPRWGLNSWRINGLPGRATKSGLCASFSTSARAEASDGGDKEPLLLYTAGTPNGRKVSVYLEELKQAYGVDYEPHKINISQNTQKEPWFIALNPNGRIPALVDRQRDNFTIFETAAILLYLAEHHDPEHRFWFNPINSSNDHSTMIQWMFWAHGGLGPMQGQLYHFSKAAPVELPYAIKRYFDETERLYNVLEIRLAGRDFLAGPGRGRYTLADINAFPWIAAHTFSGIESLERWPALNTWFQQISSREAVKKGMTVPK